MAQSLSEQIERLSLAEDHKSHRYNSSRIPGLDEGSEAPEQTEVKTDFKQMLISSAKERMPHDIKSSTVSNEIVYARPTMTRQQVFQFISAIEQEKKEKMDAILKQQQQNDIGSDEKGSTRLLDACRRMLKRYKAEEKEKKLESALQDRIEMSIGIGDGMGFSEGLRRYKRLLALPYEIAASMAIKRPGFALEPIQQEFLESFAFACAPLVYGRDWESAKIDFLQSRRIWEIIQRVLCLTPRQFGKTTVVCIFVVSLLMLIPGIKIAVFGQSQKTSIRIIEHCIAIISTHWKGSNRFANNSKTEISVIPEDAVATHKTKSSRRLHPQLATLTSLPATPDSKPFFFSHVALPLPFMPTCYPPQIHVGARFLCLFFFV